jgi:hypothetical protein
MRPMEMAGKIIDDAVRVASMRVKTFVFEDVRLPSGWTATVAVRYDGTVDGYSLVTPDGMGMVDGSGHHGTGGHGRRDACGARDGRIGDDDGRR